MFHTTLLNPNYYSHPNTFDPLRWTHQAHEDPFIFTPFSMGAKSCIGEKLSIIEVKSILSYLFIHYQYTIDTPLQDIVWVQRLVYEPMQKVQFTLTKRESTKQI